MCVCGEVCSSGTARSVSDHFLSASSVSVGGRPPASHSTDRHDTGGVRPVSEKWFHDLNSQNKLSRHRQNKIFKCMNKLFHFCERRINSCNTYYFLTLFGVFTPSKSVQAEHCVFLRQRLCRCDSD